MSFIRLKTRGESIEVSFLDKPKKLRIKMPLKLPASVNKGEEAYNKFYDGIVTRLNYKKEKISIDGKQNIVEFIFNEKKISEIIELLEKLDHFKQLPYDVINESTFAALKIDYPPRQKSKPAQKSKSSDLFKPIDRPTLNGTPFQNSCVQKIKNKENEIAATYVQKTIMGSEADLETLSAYCNLVLLTYNGELHHPKTRNLHAGEGPQKGERIGLLSKMLPHFLSLSEYVKKYGLLTREDILSSGIIDLFCVAYTEEDPDLHTNNYGFYYDEINKKWILARIDSGRGSWPYVSKYFNLLPNETNQDHIIPPFLAFKFELGDIISFPLLRQPPYHWLYGDENVFFPGALDNIEKEIKCIDTKYYNFLKRALVPNKTYEAFSNATIRSERIKNEISRHKIDRTDELKQILLIDPDFYYYLCTHPDIIRQIQQDFIDFNTKIVKKQADIDLGLRVDVAEVKDTLEQIYRDTIKSLYDTLYIAYQNQNSAMLMDIGLVFLVHPTLVNALINRFANEVDKIPMQDWFYQKVMMLDGFHSNPVDLKMLYMTLVQPNNVNGGVKQCSLTWGESLLAIACSTRDLILFWKVANKQSSLLTDATFEMISDRFGINKISVKAWLYQAVLKKEIQTCYRFVSYSNTPLFFTKIHLLLLQSIDLSTKLNSDLSLAEELIALAIVRKNSQLLTIIATTHWYHHANIDKITDKFGRKKNEACQWIVKVLKQIVGGERQRQPNPSSLFTHSMRPPVNDRFQADNFSNKAKL